MAVYAIGDLQGCYDPLVALLDKIRFDPSQDRLWFCGDLVNRGGQSLETLRLVHSLDQYSVTVLGNHDLSLLSISTRSVGEQDKANPDLRRVLRADDASVLIDWLRHRPLMHVDQELGFAMVHAGLSPRWTIKLAEARAHEVERALRGDQYRNLMKRMFGNKPAAWSKQLTGVERLRAIINVMTRMRFCDVQGRIGFDFKAEPGTQKSGFYPWFEVPGGKKRELPVVCGHWSALGLFQGLGIYSIDTGAVWGGKLTALKLGPEPQVFQVPCDARAQMVKGGE
ncbi:bis(5'-nucleosyl)-tetraphosphatase [Ahniella affigens]|uniref:bis(5'-nucleosyl)-tetraphosphatase (symmetrical) n=1 Tax=Ahniella affigens TaxID=2021234 RepID=A0A2P1PP29_9GAMM|nr:symmetrical bis(5'-nucleosyl)-tetraphosphatase [Ahniella affigens]AVP96598.1 bis(5'-nucleosyl)-tetraphosphatase [Ahniella affigens]